MSGTYTKLLYHVVFSTKNRLPLITLDREPRLHKYLGGIVRNLGGSLLEVNGMNDHVHLLLKLKPTIAISDVVRDIKANSSKWMNESVTSLRKFGWQDGYSAFSVSQSQIERVIAYIASQKDHHRRRDYKSEVLTLLRKHDIEFDEALLWR